MVKAAVLARFHGPCRSPRGSLWRPRGGRWSLKRRLGWAWLAMLLGAQPAVAEREGPEQILECVQGNRPAANAVETVEFRSTSRAGHERVQRAIVYSGRTRDPYRAVYVRLIYPSDLRGSTFLIVERGGDMEMFASLSGLPRPKQIRSAGNREGLFGTDFSYEDFARLYGMNRPGASRRLADAAEADQPSYVIETRPLAESGSSYESIVSYVDKKTCIVLKAEFYEGPDRLRKVLTAPVAEVKRVESGWIAHEVLMRDLRDGTQTRMRIEDLDIGEQVLDLPFEIGPREPDATGSP